MTAEVNSPYPPTMESILGSNLPEELYPWACAPMLITEVQEADQSTYRATWPDVSLTRDRDNAYGTLGTFLNLAAPYRQMDDGAILDDLFLQVASGKYMPNLHSKHAASFGRAWEKHDDYANRARDALLYRPTIDGFVFEEGSKVFRLGEAAILGFDEKKEELQTQMHLFSRDEIKTLFNELGIAEHDIGINTKDSTAIDPDTVSRMLDEHPESAHRLIEILQGVLFNGGEKYGGPLVAFEMGKSREELEAMLADNNEVKTHVDKELEFDYLLLSGEDFDEVVPILPSVSIRDPRPHLQPVLYWKRLQNGSREILYDAEATTRSSRNKNLTFQVVEDPMLGVLIPVIFNPDFRANEELWPKRDSLPADKVAQKRGERERVPTNNIGPATVVLQAIRKRREIAAQFPFERLEALAS